MTGINVDKHQRLAIKKRPVKYLPEREEFSDLEGSLKSLIAKV
jgi:hypothetical protein